MLNIPAEDAEGNVKQALELQQAGCEIIRLTAVSYTHLPKNELRFRAELPEYGVKFRLKYACTSAIIFLVLRKNITETWFEVRAEFPEYLSLIHI